MIEDIRPYIGIDMTLFRYYMRHKTRELRPSKFPRISIDTTMYNPRNCREALCNAIKSEIQHGEYNDTTSKESYLLIPYPSKVIRGKFIVGNATITVRTSGVNQSYVFLDNVTKCGEYIKSLNYVLGIIGTCLSSGQEERRRKNVCGTSKDCSYRTQWFGPERCVMFTYNVLSSFWMVSPMMVSLITGIARNLMAMCMDKEIDLEKSLFDKISYREIRSIIDTVDKRRALEVYDKIIEPFYKKLPTEHYVLLTDNPSRKVLRKLFEKGCFGVFTPEYTSIYWDRFGRYEGFMFFVETLKGNSNGYDYYRRLGE